MCTSPILIKNPALGRATYVSQHGHAVEIPRIFLPTDEYISVSCGKCPECRESYYSSLLQRAIVEVHTSYMYFVTLTYNNEHLPVIQLGNDDIYYSNYKDIQDCFKRFRINNYISDREFRYLCVNEYGDTYSRPHFHLLLFVGKRHDDTSSTPYTIERIIFDNLLKCWSTNIGTRKFPQYVPLLTYKTRVTPTRIESNYFVKYVTTDFTDVDLSETFVKTIRYLIGYISKGSDFDEVCKRYIDAIDDPILSQKVSHLLRCRVRFSKGFGFGFDCYGRKLYLPKISIRSSLNSIIYSDFMNHLPDSLDEFQELYPDLFRDLQKHVKHSFTFYRKFDSLHQAFNSMSSYDYIIHCLFVKFFPDTFSEIYDVSYRRRLDKPYISYLFNLDSYKYYKPKVTTSLPFSDNSTYTLLRDMVNKGLAAGIPYFTFVDVVSGNFIALCSFYKSRVVTLDDFISLYSRLKVTNYHEWQNLFEDQYSNYKALKHKSNLFSHDKYDNICRSQKKYFNLRRRLEIHDLY